MEDKINKMFHEASDIHDSVNQHYGEPSKFSGARDPYWTHIGDVLQLAMEFGKYLPEFDKYKHIIAFGACFHDAIEDARETYNDIMKRARNYFETEEEAKMATEIVYALTNEKGRTRAERANEKYYEGIRTTPFASFIKCCDRLANYNYAKLNGTTMAPKYEAEMPEFINHVVTGSDDMFYMVPSIVVTELNDKRPSMFYKHEYDQ